MTTMDDVVRLATKDERGPTGPYWPTASRDTLHIISDAFRPLGLTRFVAQEMGKTFEGTWVLVTDTLHPLEKKDVDELSRLAGRAVVAPRPRLGIADIQQLAAASD
jgi:hypothetical protein